jgi:hypothetical protein
MQNGQIPPVFKFKEHQSDYVADQSDTNVPSVLQHGNADKITGKFGDTGKLWKTVHHMQALLYAA